ncbi:hypothetical protein EVAR_81489_1 [Eumeta japonica]|uniref:Uncharacterized protein n=1 Tax=Eumeta variegata TaxID=151549 RepID=A0A4C1W0X4_EUMVA|nr:hypothetical protein EVAR_81489_1 [Eumeta japonica]
MPQRSGGSVSKSVALEPKVTEFDPNHGWCLMTQFILRTAHGCIPLEKTLTDASFSGVQGDSSSSEQLVYKVLNLRLFTIEEFQRRKKPSWLRRLLVHENAIHHQNILY